MSRKLFEVKIEYTFYAYAEYPDTAADFAEDALRDAFLSEATTAREVKHSDDHVEWEKECLVYHAGREGITLGQLLEKLPARGKEGV